MLLLLWVMYFCCYYNNMKLTLEAWLSNACCHTLNSFISPSKLLLRISLSRLMPSKSAERPSGTSSGLNPLNYMFPNLSQARDANQIVDLPTERETSSIPRGDADSNWEYPSPEQMYNAMLRKSYDDTPQDAVESMVGVHNFLNDGAWEEIVSRERRFSRGLGYDWQACRRGEEGFIEDADKVAPKGQVAKPKLLRFQGRPNDIILKARILEFLGRMYPAKFEWVTLATYLNLALTSCSFETPIDRHDWYVQRRTPQGDVRELRYVIDYHSVPESTGAPVFSLDVRPAVGGPTAVAERLMRWGGDV